MRFAGELFRTHETILKNDLQNLIFKSVVCDNSMALAFFVNVYTTTQHC